MNTTSRADVERPVRPRAALWMALIALILIAAACGGEHNSGTASNRYPAGSVTEEDMGKTLKFDARVQDYETDGDKLIVNVNQEWVSSPPGIQARALDQWYNMWQAAHRSSDSAPTKGLEVIVRHEGEDVASWTDEEGYKPVIRKKEKEDKSDSES